MGVRSLEGPALRGLSGSSPASTPPVRKEIAPVAGEALQTLPRPRAPAADAAERPEAKPRSSITISEGTRLRFDEASRRIVAQIISKENEVVKQIPPEELLKIYAKAAEIQKLIFDQSI